MIYPIAIEKGDTNHAYGVVFPDIEGCFSAGETLDEAISEAKIALEFHLEGLAELGQLPPNASDVSEHILKQEYAGFIWGVVEIDIEPYLGKSSKVNVTLPDLLQKQIDELVKSHPEYKNRSNFLQVAARHEFQRLSGKECA